MYDRPSSQFLTHKYPIWQGCTLEEIFVAVGLVLLAIVIPLIVIGFLFNILNWMLLVLIPAIFMLPKCAVQWMANYKQGKPAGFILIRARLWLDRHGIKPAPYITRIGRWSTKRGGSKHV